MLTFGSVRGRLPTEMVALHDAREPFTFADADHVDVLNAFENIDCHGIAGLAIGRIFELDLAEVLPGANAGLGGVPDERERAELRLDFAKAQLNGFIAVALDRLHLRHRARSRLHD